MISICRSEIINRLIGKSWMSAQSRTTKLILENSPEISTLRARVFSGNKQYLHQLCTSICDLLKNTDTQPPAYRQINQLLLSAQPDILSYLHSRVLDQLQALHHRDDLNQYITLWRTLGRDDPRYPNLADKLQNIHLPSSQNKLSPAFQNFYTQFAINANNLLTSQMQFFEDSSVVPSSDTESMGEQQASSAFILRQMKELEGIRKEVETLHVSKKNAQQHYQRARNFLSLKPTSLKQEISFEFNNYRVWAKQFVQNFETLKKSDSLTVYRYPDLFRPDGCTRMTSGKAIQNLGTQNKISFAKNSSQKQESLLLNRKSGPQANNLIIQIQKLQQQAAPMHFRKFDSLKEQLQFCFSKPQNFATSAPLRKQSAFAKLDPQISLRQSLQDSNKDFIISNKTKHNQINNQTIPVSSKEAYQSETIPYDETNFPIKYDYPLNINYEKHQQARSHIKLKPLTSSESNQNLIHSERSRPRPKIFGINKKYQDLSDSKQKSKNFDEQIKNQKDQNLQIYENCNSFAQIMENASPRLTFLSDGTPYSSSNQIPRISSTDILMANKKIVPLSETKRQRNLRMKNANQPASESSPKYWKLSQLRTERAERMKRLVGEQFMRLQNQIVQPYTKNFVDKNQFNEFKKKCLQDNSGWQNKVLIVTYELERLSDVKVRVCVGYLNKTSEDLLMHTLYRIPKCMKHCRVSQIHRNWVLKSSHKHTFELELVSFPLEPCFLNLKCTKLDEYEGWESTGAPVVTLPITIRNYIQCLVISPKQWDETWVAWSDLKNLHLTRNILTENQTITQLHTFFTITTLRPTSSFSTKEVGTLCCLRILNNLRFLLKVSQRAQNVVTLELLANRVVQDQDDLDFLIYCFDIWSLLLAKLEWDDVR